MENQSGIIMNKMIYADLGNTRAKFLKDGEIISIYNSELEVDDFITLLGDADLVYSSVNTRTEWGIIEALDKLPNKSYNIKEIISKEEVIKFKHIEGIGSDRVLSLLGASLFQKPPLITVECGTCNSVNLLLEDNIIAGGCIFPGMLTMFESLKEISPILRAAIPHDLHLEQWTVATGKNTRQALKSGVLASMAGGISYYIEQICKENDLKMNELPIFITGGAGQYVINELNGKICGTDANLEYHENLVLFGIKKAIEH